MLACFDTHTHTHMHMKTFRQITEGMPQGLIATFDQDDSEFELSVYKRGSGFYIDAGNYDDTANSIRELRMKLRRWGIDPDQPNFGGLPN